jgi:DNA-binding response OmpR family regulator
MNPQILFVDDEAPIRELLSLYFRKRGLSVTTARTAAEAKESTTNSGVDLAILDVNLAGENGLELVGFFKEHYPHVPIIIFTGLTGEDLVEKALAAGARGVMRKSESLGVLFTEVRRYLPAQSGEQEN